MVQHKSFELAPATPRFILTNCNYTGLLFLVLYILMNPKWPYLALLSYNDVSHTSTSANILLV